MEKRSFCKIVVFGAGAMSALFVAGPLIATAMSPVLQRRKGPAWRSLGDLAQFEPGAVQKAYVEVKREDWANLLQSKGVYVSRRPDGEVIVFSRNCTDLSCPIAWDPRSGCFFCPCHGGIFNKDGERLAGPPKRPLYRYAARIREGRLEIDINSLPVIT